MDNAASCELHASLAPRTTQYHLIRMPLRSHSFAEEDRAWLLDLRGGSFEELPQDLAALLCRNGRLILDGELIDAMHSRPSHGAAAASPRRWFLVFDAVVVAGEDVGALPDYVRRLAAADSFLRALPDVVSTEPRLVVKEFAPAKAVRTPP